MTHRTRIKICGLTRSQDVAAVVAAGADAVGFVFYPPSPRYVSAAAAAALAATVPPFVSTDGNDSEFQHIIKNLQVQV